MNTQASNTAPVQSDTYREPLDAAANALDMACSTLDQLVALLTVLAFGSPSMRTAVSLAGLGQYIAMNGFDMIDETRRATWPVLGVQHDALASLAKFDAGAHAVRINETPEAAAALAVFANSPGTAQTAAGALDAGIAAVQRIAGLAAGIDRLRHDNPERETLARMIRNVENSAIDSMNWELMRQQSAIAEGNTAPAAPAREKEGSQPRAPIKRWSVLDMEDAINDVKATAWGLNCAHQLESADHLIDACMTTLTAATQRLEDAFAKACATQRADIVLQDSQSKTLAPNGRRFDLRVTDTGADLLLLEHGKLHSTIAFSGPDPVMDAERAGREWLRGADVPAMARKAA